MATDIHTTELFCFCPRHEQGTKHSLGPHNNLYSMMANSHMMARGNPFLPTSCWWRVGMMWFSLGNTFPAARWGLPVLAVWSHHVLLFLPQDPVLFPHRPFQGWRCLCPSLPHATFLTETLEEIRLGWYLPLGLPPGALLSYSSLSIWISIFFSLWGPLLWEPGGCNISAALMNSELSWQPTQNLLYSLNLSGLAAACCGLFWGRGQCCLFTQALASHLFCSAASVPWQ